MKFAQRYFFKTTMSEMGEVIRYDMEELDLTEDMILDRKKWRSRRIRVVD